MPRTVYSASNLFGVPIRPSSRRLTYKFNLRHPMIPPESLPVHLRSAYRGIARRMLKDGADPAGVTARALDEVLKKADAKKQNPVA